MLTLIRRRFREICSIAFATPLLILLLLGLGGVASAQGPVYRFVGKGAFGSANWSWSDPSINGWVYVARGGTAKEPMTWLQYYVSLADDPWTALEAGWGSIPNGDLIGNGVTALSLNTDTSASANSGFYRYAGDGGVIAIDWNAMALWWSRSSCSSQSHFSDTYYGDIAVHYSGPSECSSASFQGSVFDTSVEGSSLYCGMGTNHQVLIQVQQGP